MRARGRQRGARTGGAGPDDLHQLYGIHPVLEALRARRRQLYRLWVRAGRRRPELREVAVAAGAIGVPVQEVVPEQLVAALPPGLQSQGVLLECGPLPEVPLAELAQAGKGPRTLVALDRVEDPQNLGAILRVAEAAGAGGLVLTRHRAPPLSPAVARASAGALEWLPVARVPNLARALNQLKLKGFWLFGGEPEAPEDLFGLPERVIGGDRVVVLGAEGRGLRPGIAGVLDHRVQIPMAGRIASLNVSAAAAVVLFELGRRRGRLASSGDLTY
jgi:23S rRNA (guanosine2251-2'-O)-methyltransferase